MVSGLVPMVPRLITAITAAGGVINVGARRGLGAGLGGLPGIGAGRGLFRTIVGGLGIEAVADIFGVGFNDLFGPDEADRLAGLVEEMVDSGYIMWDPTDRRGQPREMEFVVIPIGNANGRPYGMAYRPFSKSAIRKHDQNQDTYRRSRRAPRSNRRTK